jgi:hypothetical protein
MKISSRSGENRGVSPDSTCPTFLIDVLSQSEKAVFLALVTMWAAVLGWFWRWWLQADHITNLTHRCHQSPDRVEYVVARLLFLFCGSHEASESSHHATQLAHGDGCYESTF